MNGLQAAQLQNRANTMLDAWLKTATGSESVKGTTVSKREANALLAQAKGLPAGELENLKKAFLASIQANTFTVAPDAQKVFAEFFKVPAESIPVTSTARSQVNSAQQTRVANESEHRSKVSSKEVRDFVKNAEALPPNLKELVGNALMGQLQAGNYKLDADARAMLTRFVAQAGGNGNGMSMTEGARLATDLQSGAAALDRVVRGQMMNAPRHMLAEVVNRVEGRGGLDALDRSLSLGAQPMSYAQYVAMHGGSFEDILFAFLMQLADKADKKLMEKMKEMERTEKLQAKTGQADARIKELLGEPGATAPGATPGAAGGGVGKVSSQLDALVQSVHSMVQADSAGGAQVTQAEADKLVARLETLPPKVQDLLAGSIAAAMRSATMNMQPEAQEALVKWGKGVRGDAFDIQKTAEPPPPPPEHGKIGEQLAKSGKLEDKLAAFLVDTLTSDTMTLKEKFKPFKALRDEVDKTMGPMAQQVIPQMAEPPADAAPAKKTHKGKPKMAAEEAAPPPAPAAMQAPQGPAGEPQPGTLPDEPAKSDATNQNELQRIMNERNRIFEMLSNMMKAMHDMIMTSVRNMR
ncbi:MAG: hypothetical protein HY904_13730 [Deltaproteobacteria bacterium]|nr:hypothetical protein [Deltaproteobacteria bacterium]